MVIGDFSSFGGISVFRLREYVVERRLYVAKYLFAMDVDLEIRSLARSFIGQA